MLPLPVVEPEVKSSSIESMSSSPLNEEPVKKRRRSSGSAAAKGRKPWVLLIGFIQAHGLVKITYQDTFAQAT